MKNKKNILANFYWSLTLLLGETKLNKCWSLRFKLSFKIPLHNHRSLNHWASIDFSARLACSYILNSFLSTFALYSKQDKTWATFLLHSRAWYEVFQKTQTSQMTHLLQTWLRFCFIWFTRAEYQQSSAKISSICTSTTHSLIGHSIWRASLYRGQVWQRWAFSGWKFGFPSSKLLCVKVHSIIRLLLQHSHFCRSILWTLYSF